MSDFRGAQAIDWQGDVGIVSYGGDDKLVVWFLRKSVPLGKASEEAGRPIFEGRDYVHIQHPGERDYNEREATDLDRQRFPRQWAAYQNNQEQLTDGTPLAVLFPAEPEIVDTMRPLRIHTVEQLAALTEQAISRLGMGGRTHVERAKRFLDESKAAKPFHKLKGELEAALQRIAELETTQAALAAQATTPKG